MTITEKIAYIKGLAEGLSLDESKPEVKVLNAVVDLLDDLAYEVQDMQELYDELSAVVDEIDEDLADVESELYDDDDDDDEDDFDDFDEDDDDFDDDDDVFYEVTCDACGKAINVSEDVLLEGEITCPNCGETIEFDFSDLFDENGDLCDNDCSACSEKETCDKDEKETGEKEPEE